MTNPANAQSLVEERVAQVQAYKAQIPDMPREAIRGYPVPVLEGSRMWLAFPFFLRRGLPPKPPELTLPGWVVLIDVDTGKDIVAHRLDNDLSATVGAHVIDPPLDMKPFVAAEREMYRLLSELLPIARNPSAGVPPRLRSAADEFTARWRQLAHKPLANAYRAINPHWFKALGL